MSLKEKLAAKRLAQTKPEKKSPVSKQKTKPKTISRKEKIDIEEEVGAPVIIVQKNIKKKVELPIEETKFVKESIGITGKGGIAEKFRKWHNDNNANMSGTLCKMLNEFNNSHK